MPSSYTTSLRLVLPVTGELLAAWGDTVNNGLTELVEDAIAGSVTVAMGNANVTLSTANEAVDQARNMFINCTGAHTAQRTLNVPTVSKLYFVHNGTTGGYNIFVRTPAGGGVLVPPGARRILYCNGTDVLNAYGADFGLSIPEAVDAATARTILGFGGAIVIGGRLSVAGAYTPSLQPAHSATPTFDCAASNVFEPGPMTGNVTSITMSNAVGGQTVNIRFVQDATGGRTVAVPAGAKISGNLNTAISSVTWLVMTYSARASRWEGSWAQVPA